MLTACRYLGVFAVLGFLLAGCGDSPNEPADELYTLVRVNRTPLPAPIGLFGSSFKPFEVTGGSLLLRADGTYVMTTAVRCRPDLPPGTCELSSSEASIEGSYSREDGWIELGDRQYPLTFDGPSVTVSLVLPPSLGVIGGDVYEYRR